MTTHSKTQPAPSASAIVRDLRNRLWSEMRDLANGIVDDPFVADALVEGAFRALRRLLRDGVVDAHNDPAAVLARIVVSKAITCTRTTLGGAPHPANDNGGDQREEVA